MKRLVLPLACLLVAVFIFGERYVDRQRASSDQCITEGLTEFPVVHKETYESFYSEARKRETHRSVQGALVNHHLLAGSLIAEVMSSFEGLPIETVVLISPNHFDHGQGSIQTSLMRFDTPLGVVETDCDALRTYLIDSGIKVEDRTFRLEHGILNILPFIAKSLPHARVVAISVKERVSHDALDKLAKDIAKIPRSIVVGSFDFAHDMPRAMEELKDAKSIDAISSFDLERVKNVSVDSKAGLYLLLQSMAERGAKDFKLFANSNSGAMTDSDPNDATSYITGVFDKGEAAASRTVTMLMFGDMMLDREVAARMEIHGDDHLLASVPGLLGGIDIVALNLEGVMSHNESIARHNSSILRFTFDPRLAPLLSRWRIDAVSQANNHTNDFGRGAAKESRDVLRDAGLGVFGDYFNELGIIFRKEIAGKKIALIGFNEFASEGDIARLIAKTKVESDLVIVMPHWGDEYVESSNARQQRLARLFIDSGADAVVGSHPHVVQELSLYKGKLIAYSLGNFIFDQDFSKATTEGLALGLAFNESMEYYLMPFRIARSQVQLMSKEERASFLQALASRSDASLSADILEAKIRL